MKSQRFTRLYNVSIILLSTIMITVQVFALMHTHEIIVSSYKYSCVNAIQTNPPSNKEAVSTHASCILCDISHNPIINSSCDADIIVAFSCAQLPTYSPLFHPAFYRSLSQSRAPPKAI